MLDRNRQDAGKSFMLVTFDKMPSTASRQVAVLGDSSWQPLTVCGNVGDLKALCLHVFTRPTVQVLTLRR